MYFYVIQTVFKLFKNHKNQRSQIVLNFILKILQSAKNQTGSIFFHLKIAQLYIIIYFYIIQTVFKLFKNHKNQRSQIVLNFILKILQSAKSQTGSIFFHLKIAQLYIIMYFYVIQTVFKLFKNHKNQRSQIVLNFILKILQSAKNQTRLIFFHLKIAQLYIIMYFYIIQTVFKLFKNHKNQRSQIVLNFILKILQSAKYQTGLIFFHLKIAQLYIIMYFYVIQTVFKLFKNHKNQRSQIVLNFILKILQSAKYQTGLIFFHLKIAQLYIIMYFYVIQTVFKLFKNHKNQRSQIVLNFILKILQSAKNQTGSIFFHLKIAQLYIIMYFYVIQTVFKLFKNHKNQRSQIMLNFILKILQSAKSQTRLIFFHLKIAQLYIIMYFYVIQTVFKPFKNHKNQRSQIMLDFILKILQSAKYQTRIDFFSPQNNSVIYNYIFLCYLDCFQTI